MRRVLIALILLSSLFAAADDSINTLIPAKKHHLPGKQDQIMMGDNPYTSVLGFITKADIFDYHGNLVTSIAVQPLGLSQIYEVNLAFCGNEADRLKGKTGLVVITYRKQKSTEYCNDLFDVRETVNNE